MGFTWKRKVSTLLSILMFAVNLSVSAQTVDGTESASDNDHQTFEYGQTFRTYMGAGLDTYFGLSILGGFDGGLGYYTSVKQDLSKYFSISGFLHFSGSIGGSAGVYLLNGPHNRLGAEAGVYSRINDEVDYTFYTAAIKYDHKVFGRASGCLKLSAFLNEEHNYLPLLFSASYNVDILIFDFSF